MADADVDGSHIRTLLLTFFFRFMRPLIEEGHIYLAQPPLFKIYRGKKVRYAYSDPERDQIIAEMTADGGKSGYPAIQKVLVRWMPNSCGKLPWIREHRTTIQVTMEDAGAGR